MVCPVSTLSSCVSACPVAGAASNACLSECTLACTNAQALPSLKFAGDGSSFKILQLADTQVSDFIFSTCSSLSEEQQALGRCTAYNTTDFISRLIEDEQPDFIVYTGDNIVGSVRMEDTMSKIYGPVIASGLPWSAVFGNHDPEAVLKQDWQMEWIENAPNSIVEKGPEELHGVGNYVIQVQASDSDEPLFNLWMMDSGDYSKVAGVGGYDWVYLDQIMWYSEMSKALEAQAGKSSITGLSFMHIPPPEYWDASEGEIVGEMQEAVYAANVNSGLLTEMRTRGDVKLMTVGHDHVNDFCGVWQGINLCYGGGMGYTTYGRADWARRARVFELYEGGEIVSYKRLDNAEFSKIDEQQLFGEPLVLKSSGPVNRHFVEGNPCDLPLKPGALELPVKCLEE